MKLKLKETAMQLGGNAIGGYVGEMASEKIIDMVEDDLQEKGALLIGAVGSALLAVNTKGFISDIAAGSTAEFGKQFIKAMMESTIAAAEVKDKPKTDPKKPVKGTETIEDELAGIYDEINEALNGTDTTDIFGNETMVAGNEEQIFG